MSISQEEVNMASSSDTSGSKRESSDSEPESSSAPESESGYLENICEVLCVSP